MERNEDNSGSVLDDSVLQAEGGSGISELSVALEIRECLELLAMENILPAGITINEVRLELAKGIAPLVRKLPEPERIKRIKELLLDAAETLLKAKKTEASPSQSVVVLTMGPDESPRVTSVPSSVGNRVKSALQSLFSAASRAAM
jgi:hypothetical protein